MRVGRRGGAYGCGSVGVASTPFVSKSRDCDRGIYDRTTDQSTRNCTISANIKVRICRSRGKLVSTTRAMLAQDRQTEENIQAVLYFREYTICTKKLYIIAMVTILV